MFNLTRILHLIPMVMTLFFLFPQVEQAQVIPQVEHVNAFSSPKEYVLSMAREYGVNPDLANYVATKESNYLTSAIGDMNIVCARTGEPTRARGVWQITECWHPEVSDECAFDLVCSTEWAMPRLAEKRSCLQEWTTCRWYYGQK